MSEKVKAEAEQTVAMVDEVNAVVLPVDDGYTAS